MQQAPNTSNDESKPLRINEEHHIYQPEVKIQQVIKNNECRKYTMIHGCDPSLSVLK